MLTQNRSKITEKDKKYDLYKSQKGKSDASKKSAYKFTPEVVNLDLTAIIAKTNNN
jgi:hypothetical protein